MSGLGDEYRPFAHTNSRIVDIARDLACYGVMILMLDDWNYRNGVMCIMISDELWVMNWNAGMAFRSLGTGETGVGLAVESSVWLGINLAFAGL